MKKIIAFALTLILLCSISSAFAAYPNDEPVIGNFYKNINDGIPNFADNDSTQVNVSVQVGSIGHRYAVDVEFTAAVTLDFSSIELVWDVNNLEYNLSADADAVALAPSTITVFNYSDLPVYLSTAITNDDANDGITVTADKTTATVAKATPKVGATPGSATQETITLSATSTNWNEVIRYYANKDITETVVGTCTLTISMNP